MDNIEQLRGEGIALRHSLDHLEGVSDKVNRIIEIELLIEKASKKTLQENPENITVCFLECVAMPNGEIICAGETIGWVSEIGKYLKIKQ